MCVDSVIRNLEVDLLKICEKSIALGGKRAIRAVSAHSQIHIIGVSVNSIINSKPGCWLLFPSLCGADAKAIFLKVAA